MFIKNKYIITNEITEIILKKVSPTSNNAYKDAAPPGTIQVSNKGGAFLMPQKKLTIVPVTLHSESKYLDTPMPPATLSKQHLHDQNGRR
ncbi:hypothetical protein [Alkalihalobacterium alkalinitrilicum]|uniref:hypothetical protein n=1 Tax=Alkalihalobacterium alkalinitrilicum TaxID=427920 RepID=UPI0030846AF4